MQLFQAHNQWKTRPTDERFKTLEEMNLACHQYKSSAVEAEVNYNQLRVEVLGEDIQLIGKTGTYAKLSHYAMGQMSQRIGAPTSYLRELPATLAAQNLNHGLKVRGEKNPTDKAMLLLHEQNQSLILRAATTEKYTRIWNADITSKLLDFQKQNPQWKNPLAYKISPLGNKGSWPILTGEMEPAGLYASDHDMFAFLIDESKTLEGSPKGLNRGFFIWNSEVGDKSMGGSFFLFDRVCGNNIVWGASNVIDFKIRHVGNADWRAFQQIRMELKRYAESSGSQAESMIKIARSYVLGGTKADALSTLLAMASKVKAPELTQARLSEALTLAEQREDRYGNPRTLWAAVSGLTEASQWKNHADERVKIDRAAGKLLKTIQF